MMTYELHLERFSLENFLKSFIHFLHILLEPKSLNFHRKKCFLNLPQKVLLLIDNVVIFRSSLNTIVVFYWKNFTRIQKVKVCNNFKTKQ